MELRIYLLLHQMQKLYFAKLKQQKGKQRESQKRFQAAVEKLGHTYILAKKVEDLCLDFYI